MNGLMFGGIILCAFVVFTYMLLVGKSEMETEYDKKKDDEEQMQFIKKYNDSHILLILLRRIFPFLCSGRIYPDSGNTHRSFSDLHLPYQHSTVQPSLQQGV